MDSVFKSALLKGSSQTRDMLRSETSSSAGALVSYIVL